MLKKHKGRDLFHPRLSAGPSVGVGFPGAGIISIVQVGKLRHRAANLLVHGHTVGW